MAFLHTGASNICELQHTHLTAFSKYSKASAYFAYFSKACPTLLKSLAFLVFTFNADLKMLYSDSLKVKQEAHGPHRSPEKTVQINKHI